MPAIDVEKARSINKRVRAAFKRGYKSSNKVYSLRTEEDAIDLETLIQRDPEYRAQYRSRLRVLKRHEAAGQKVRWPSPARARRYENALEAGKRRKPLTTYSATAKALEETSEFELAGNCSEMAIYAAAIVSREHQDAQAFTYIAKLQSPSDHLFCVVAKDPSPAKLYSLFLLNKYSNWVVIDPWLNVCCLASNYYQQAANQLQKWATSGKRILWQGKLYIPTGSYKTSFTSSGVTFNQYR